MTRAEELHIIVAACKHEFGVLNYEDIGLDDNGLWDKFEAAWSEFKDIAQTPADLELVESTEQFVFGPIDNHHMGYYPRKRWGKVVIWADVFRQQFGAKPNKAVAT